MALAEPQPPSAAALPRRHPVARYVLLAMVFVAVVLVAQGIYYRGRIEDRLALARRELPLNPQQAFMHFRPVNNYSNLLTLGRVAEAQQEFINDLRDNVIRSFAYNAVPGNQHFQQAQQTAAVMRDMQAWRPEEARAVLRQIVAIAGDAVPRVRDQGTLSALENAMLLFDFLRGQQVFTPANMPDYEAWRRDMFQVDQGPLALRDALDAATGYFNLSLLALGVTGGTDAAWPLAPIPPALGDDMLITCIENLQRGLNVIGEHQAAYPDEITSELLGYQARLRYNLGILKLRHAQERGATLPAMGSEFMAYLMIDPDLPRVPAPPEMYTDFLDQTRQDFDFAEGILTTPGIESDPGRAAVLALLLHRARQGLAALTGQPPPAPPAPDALARIPAGQAKLILEDPNLPLLTRLN